MRAGWPGAALALASVYVQSALAPAGGLLALDLSRARPLAESFAWYALGAAAAALFIAPLVARLAALSRGRTPGVNDYAGAVAGAWRLWLAGVIYSLGTAAGAVLLVFPGLFLSVAWVLYAPAAVVGGAAPLAALRGSFARARRGWGRLVALIAGPYIVYGVVYAIGIAPTLFTAMRFVGRAAERGSASTPGLEHFLAVHAAPVWWVWGVLPALSAGARLYLRSAVVTAWFELGDEPEVDGPSR